MNEGIKPFIIEGSRVALVEGVEQLSEAVLKSMHEYRDYLKDVGYEHIGEHRLHHNYMNLSDPVMRSFSKRVVNAVFARNISIEFVSQIGDLLIDVGTLDIEQGNSVYFAGMPSCPHCDIEFSEFAENKTELDELLSKYDAKSYVCSGMNTATNDFIAAHPAKGKAHSFPAVFLYKNGELDFVQRGSIRFDALKQMIEKHYSA